MTQTGYRIGYMNPWRDKAENQAFQSLREGARRIGHDFIHVTTSEEVLAAGLDFVIAVASTQPKLTEVPTFGAIHEPRVRFWEKPEYFQNLLTYDGYMTIADTLHGFLNSFCAGAGKPQHVGFYYNTPQRQEISADIEGLAARGELGLCYFGTNWDPRSRPLFRALVRNDYMRVYGPKESWAYLQGERYFGSPRFDGSAVQKEYAAHGVGLALLSLGHALDDVVSNRLFEIASVGAVAICPDIPWIRKYFGDNVYYFNPNGTIYESLGDIDTAMKAIAADPKDAAARAKRARAIFEETFCSEVMVANAVKYFEEWKARGGRREPPSESPLIDVVVRVGGRPVEVILRAIRSLEAQTAGHFRVVFIRYKPIDVSAITSMSWERIETFEVVDCLGGDRATTMTAGMRNVTSDYFAFLDDDDFILPNHFQGLIRQIDDAAPGRLFAYSSFLHVKEGEEITDPEPDGPETRQIHLGLKPAQGDAWEILGHFAPNGFLASRELIQFLDLDGWTMHTAEDTLMIATLAAHGDPRFSYRASACHVTGSEGASNFQETATRDEDVFEVFLRMQTVFDRLERNFGTPSMTNWERLGWKLQQVMKAKSRTRIGALTRLVLEEGVLTTSIHERDDLELRPVPLNPITMQSIGESRMHPIAGGSYEMAVLPEASPWAFGAVMVLDRGLMFPGRQWVVAEFDEAHQGFCVGILDAEGHDFQTRNEVPASSVPVEMWLHVHAPDDISRFVIQNWTDPLREPVRLKRLWIARDAQARPST
jgi:hypothetical protein